MSSRRDSEVVIIGAGLAGLCCARALVNAGVDCLILEAADRAGGRVGSECVEGFTLDRGFQVLLTAYPEASRTLDMDALHLGCFYPGALIRADGRFLRLADPWRRPLDGVRSLFAPVLTFADAFRMMRLRHRALSALHRPVHDELSTATYLREQRFSERAMLRFFRPFFGGVFLERELATPRAMFDFVFAMFSIGSAALPRGGMQAIPDQLTAGLPPSCLNLNCPVVSLEDGTVMLQSGEAVAARKVVLSTDVTSATALMPVIRRRAWHGTTTIYFAAERPPIDEPVLVLDGTGQGPVNHLCVPSGVTDGYAPPGAALISVSIIGVHDLGDPALEATVREQMRDWFGPSVAGWRHLRTYRIREALPQRSARRPEDESARYHVAPGLYACGDYLESASIDGAMVAGRRAAESILKDRSAAGAR